MDKINNNAPAIPVETVSAAVLARRPEIRPRIIACPTEPTDAGKD
jgi:hypothetical protein